MPYSNSAAVKTRQLLRENAPCQLQPGKRDSHVNPEHQERSRQGQAEVQASFPPEPFLWKMLILWQSQSCFSPPDPPLNVPLAAGGKWGATFRVWEGATAICPTSLSMSTSPTESQCWRRHSLCFLLPCSVKPGEMASTLQGGTGRRALSHTSFCA